MVDGLGRTASPSRRDTFTCSPHRSVRHITHNVQTFVYGSRASATYLEARLVILLPLPCVSHSFDTLSVVVLQGGRVGVVCRLDRGQLCIQPAGPHESVEGVTLPRRLALQHFRVAHAQQVWGHTHPYVSSQSALVGYACTERIFPLYGVGCSSRAQLPVARLLGRPP
jgi:hypothetical protein